jgi:hypothetical protein
MAQEVSAPMHDQRNPRGLSPRNSSLAPARQDVVVQRALLALVLAEHPTPLTAPGLILKLADDPTDFGQQDAVERAIRDLVGVGLLQPPKPFAWATRAALRFQQREMDCFGGGQS